MHFLDSQRHLQPDSRVNSESEIGISGEHDGERYGSGGDGRRHISGNPASDD